MIMPRQILFLCTGNYYRSRFAEEVFNHLARQAGLDWVASSRGLAPDPRCNVGPISRHAASALAVRGLSPTDAARMPMELTESDLSGAHLIVALKEAEHRQMLRRQFPSWPDKVRYWHIHDLDLATPEQATGEIEQLIKALMEDLRKNGPEPG
jgi:protein-tyrosine phosphatase